MSRMSIDRGEGEGEVLCTVGCALAAAKPPYLPMGAHDV